MSNRKKTCDTCGKDKVYSAFVSGEATCKACQKEAGIEPQSSLAKQIAARKHRREVLKQEKQLARNEAAQKRAAKKYNAKKRKARNAAEQELAARELARRKLLHFTKRFNDKYDAGWVHDLICAKLDKFSQDVADKKSPRLMIFMPPRSGKSELASKNFPAKHIGMYSDHEIIASSYAVSLPMDFSLAIKEMMVDPSYQTLFPETKLHPKAQATDGWKTTEGGGYVPAGVGGGITGKGGHILIYDDPVKDAQEADSETQRQKVWDWWDSTLSTRIAPGGGILGIQTRWNDDDLSGRLLRQMAEATKEVEEERLAAEEQYRKGEIDKVTYRLEKNRLDRYEEEITQWEVLSFPAVATHDEWLHEASLTLVDERVIREEIGDVLYTEVTDKRKEEIANGELRRKMFKVRGYRLLRVKDEALHPTRFDELHFRKEKRSKQPRFWSAMYQQNPVPEEGVYFTKDMFRFEPVVADYRLMKVYIAWDLAIGQKQTNDWTVGLVGAHDYDDRIHLINMVRVRTKELAEIIMDTAGQYKEVLQMMGLEQGQIQMSIMPNLEREMRRRRHYVSMDNTLRPVTDKLARARPAQGWMQQGRIYLPQNQPWIETFQQELLRFPGGLHDDIIDALAWLVRMIAGHQPPQRPKKLRTKSWRDKLRVTNQQGSTGAMSA